MEFVKFIFSSVWIWLGCLVLLVVVIDGVVKLVKAVRGGRTIKIHHFEKTGTKVVEIAGADSADVSKAVALESVEKEEQNDD